jgi:hypothetical protein
VAVLDLALEDLFRLQNFSDRIVIALRAAGQQV